jgi:hypothetical protein
MTGQADRFVHAQSLGQGFAGLGCPHALHRVVIDMALARQPGVETPPGRQHEGNAAGAATCAVHPGHPAPHVGGLHPPMSRPASITWPGPGACQRVGIQAHRAFGQATLHAHMLQVARHQRGGRPLRPAGLRNRVHAGSAGVQRAQAREGRAGRLADAGQEIGAHVGREALRVARGQHQQAKSLGRCTGTQGISASEAAADGSTSHCAASRPGLLPQ